MRSAHVPHGLQVSHTGIGIAGIAQASVVGSDGSIGGCGSYGRVRLVRPSGAALAHLAIQPAATLLSDDRANIGWVRPGSWCTCQLLSRAWISDATGGMWQSVALGTAFLESTWIGCTFQHIMRAYGLTVRSCLNVFFF